MITRGAWRLLAALAALNVLSYVDRQLVAALAPVLMADLGLTRTQVGLLIGPAFIVVFALSTGAMSILADRHSRTRLVAASLGLWSAATALTGTASGVLSLGAWRALVGVGEGSLSPASLAMLGDTFPPSRLGFANGVFYAGIPVGFACSYALAGWLAPWLGWRACFFVLGVVGLAGVAFVWRLAEPLRQAAVPPAAQAAVPPAAQAAAPPAAAVPPAAPAAASPGGSAFARLHSALAAEPAIALLILGGAAFAYTSAASQHGITWLVHERGFEYRRAAWLSALVVATAGLAGNLGIGALTDRARRGSAGHRLRALAAIGLVCLLLGAGYYTAPAGSPLFFACWLGTQAWLLGWYGPVVAAVVELTPPESRATVVGFTLLVVNVLGVATGPWVTGAIGDRVSLTQGLLVSLVATALGLLLVLLAAARIRPPRVAAPVLPSAATSRRS